MTSMYGKLTTAATVAALAFGLAACGGGGSSTKAPGTPTTPTPPEPTEPTELQAAQTAAADAAMAAKKASDDAAMAAGNARIATQNLATMQTGATSGGLAQEAQDAADKAMAAYMTARSTSEDAAAATTIFEAVRAKLRAEAAQADAEMYAEMAAEKGTASGTAADMELMISGTMKSVGDAMVDADAPSRVATTVTNGKSATVHTGPQENLKPQQVTDAVAGVAFDTLPNPDTAYVQAVAPRTLDIGKTVDSEDDKTRLMLITHYAGSRMVPVFTARGRLDTTVSVYGADGDDGSRAGQIFTFAGPDGSAPSADDIYVPLHDVGMFYRVGTPPSDQSPANRPDPLGAGIVLAADAKPERVYRFTHLGSDGAVGGIDSAADSVRYVVVAERETTLSTGRIFVRYRYVDVEAPAADANNDGTPEQVRVGAALPVAEAYKHLHFGVWAGLGDADDDGSQAIADMGIGFVQSIGDGLAGDDMPNYYGSASYAGNWVAAVQEMGDGGAVSLTSGAASLSADFGKGEITATLSGLATLSGDISGNTFSGDNASGIAHTSLDAGADFEGSFSGGFYGSKAAEAGGIFDFASNVGGAFRGAFGAARTDD